MKLNAKKTYCRKCKRLVHGQEQYLSERLSIVCARCGDTIWVKDRLTWRPVQR